MQLFKYVFLVLWMYWVC